MMHELIGNGAEAEALLWTGKEISNFHGLSVFCIVFTSSLGIYNDNVSGANQSTCANLETTNQDH